MKIDSKAKKVLIAVDGSRRSIAAVRNFARLNPFHQAEVVLFHVYSGVPECYWDLEKEPKSVKVVKHVKAWEKEQKRAIAETMDRARRILWQSGFPKEKVTVKIRNRRQGFARDIVAEAKNGYDAVVIRRRGRGALRSMVMGSVATKLLEKLTFVPLLIMGRDVVGGKILVGLDRSDGALRALNFVAANLGGFDYDVHLAYVLRSETVAKQEVPEMDVCETETWRGAALQAITGVFEEAKRRLVEHGFNPNQISTEVITGVVSRSAALVKTARAGGYSVIVVGRRGLSQPRSFSIGRVSNKVVHLGRKLSVWVVK